MGVGEDAGDGVEAGWGDATTCGSSAAAIAPLGGWVKKSVTVPAATIAIPTPKSAWEMRRRFQDGESTGEGRTE